jgi:HK97 gp10 family phage protein
VKNRIKVEGVEKLNRNIDALRKKYGSAVFDAGNAVANMIRTTAVQSIQDVSQGAIAVRYTAAGNAYEHTVSAPGAAPNTDTGALVRSIAVEIEMGDIFVGSTLPYASHLEFGTTTMQPRPWLIPAVERNRNNALKEFKFHVDKVGGDV